VGTVRNVVHQVKDAVTASATHTEQYEGVQEEGLRMLMFGKPGSGKVSPTKRPHSDNHITLARFVR